MEWNKNEEKNPHLQMDGTTASCLAVLVAERADHYATTHPIVDKAIIIAILSLSLEQVA